MKSKNSTSKMMYNLLISLIPFIIFATYKNGIYPSLHNHGNLYLVFKPLIYIIISMLVGLTTEYLYYLLIKKDKKSIIYLIEESFAIIPGIFIALIISINTPIWLIILASVLASLSKMIFGGLGKNKLNPALFGSLFIIVIFSNMVGGYLNLYEIDTVTTATPLSNMMGTGYVITYDNLVKPFGSLFNFFIGTIPGAIGETSSLLCIIAFIYLVVNKVIKWRIPVSYILTVTLISLIVCLTKEIGAWFILFNLLSGGLLFGAVFMATDPVTTPISHNGQISAGIILGILTMYIRYLTHYPEGVLISILILNIITILINYLGVKLYNKKTITSAIFILLALLSIFLSFRISANIANKVVDSDYQIISKEKIDNKIEYVVSGRGYAGNNSLKLKIVFARDNITQIYLLHSNETYTKMIEDNNYLNKVINSQNNLDNLDTIAGCTYTSKYIKEIVEKTKKDYLDAKK